MLILTRKPGESLYIGDAVKVTIMEIKGNQIRIGIDAPKDLRIYREEIYLQILEENKSAAAPQDVDLSSFGPVFSGGGGSGSDDDEQNAGRSPVVKSLQGFATSSSKPKKPSDPTAVVVRRKPKKNDE